MISEPNNGEEEVKSEDLPICQNCRFWARLLVNKQLHMAMGACTNSEGELAPHGIITGHFGGCEDFAKTPPPKLVQVPDKILNRIIGK